MGCVKTPSICCTPLNLSLPFGYFIKAKRGRCRGPEVRTLPEVISPEMRTPEAGHEISCDSTRSDIIVGGLQEVSLCI